MKGMHTIAVATVIGAFAALSACGDTASRYVQDGLIACWDGVENAGVGVHNPSATTWTDLVDGREFTLYNVTIADNRMVFGGTKTSYGTLDATDTTATFGKAKSGSVTVEIVYASTTAGTDNKVIMESTTDSGVAFGINKGDYLIVHNKTSTKRIAFTPGTAFSTVSLRYTSGAFSSARVNGSTATMNDTASYWAGADNVKTTIGKRTTQDTSPFPGALYCIRVYNRHLTDAEIAGNHSIDIRRFIEGNTDNDNFLVVSGTPYEIEEPIPTYGLHTGLSQGDSFAVSCPPVWTNAAGDTAASCLGWKLYDFAGNVVASGGGNAFTYVHPTPAEYRGLEWQWEVKYKITANAGDGGTVSPAEQWVVRGVTATVTANPNPTRSFYKWTGDLPAGVSAYERTISFPSDQPRTLNAGFGDKFYLSKTGSDANDGTSWASAFATVTNAVAKGYAAGSVVVISNGTYDLPKTISLTNAITLRGLTGNPNDVILRRPSSASAKYRLFDMKHRESILSGLALQGGCHSGTYTSGGGVYIYSAGGTITNCILRSNKTDGHHAINGYDGTGSAVYCVSSYGVVTHCVISNNTTTVYDNNYGGPVCMNYGRIDNCLVTKHSDTSSNYGGMIVLNNSAAAENCTVVANNAKGNAGIYTRNASSRVRNCVIAANTTTSARAADTVWGGTASCFTNCVSDANAPNAQCHAGADLVFADATTGNWRPTLASSAVDVGGTVVNGATLDLDGNPRHVDAIDAGCYELQKNGLIAGFTPDLAAAFLPASVTFTAVVGGAGEGAVLEYRWDFDNDGTIDDVTSSPSVTHTYTAGGIYSVTLTVADTTSDESASSTLLNVFKANPRTLYVVNGNADAAEPYDTWATAANTIQKAINYSAAGAEIVVSNGTYKISSRIYVDKVLNLHGLTGRPEDVIVDGQSTTRCLELNAGRAALIHSFTFRNGNSNGAGSGSGAFVHTAGGTVSNCIVRGCSLKSKWNVCSGLYGGCDNALFTHCVVTNNTSNTGQTDGTTVAGMAVHLTGKSRLEHSLVANNRYIGGWGESTVQVANGAVRFCTIVGNKARDFGGVNLAGDTAKVEHCIIEGNTSSWTDTNACPNAVRFKVWGSVTSPAYTAAKVYTNDMGRATVARSHQITNCVADAVLVNDWCLQEPLSVTLPKYQAQGDPTPGAGSKARNAVAPATAGAMPETDLYRRPRLFGARYDIGAVECQRNSSLVIFVQ